jgi:hypothetical protein
MNSGSAQRALGASGASLLVAVGCLVLFLPPMLERTTASVPLVVFVAMALAAALLLHWVFLGIAARRMGRTVAGWVGLAVLLFPIGGVAALMLLSFFVDEAQLDAARQ